MISKKRRKVRRRIYHIFKRKMPDGEIFTKKCLEKPGTAITTIFLNLAMIDRAIKADGQGDAQNCAGAFCTREHRKSFGHSVGYLVDWWRSRVYIDEGNEKRDVCRVYAHYDNTEELFDTDESLKRLRRKVEKAGPKGLEITLYPINTGKHPRTGKPTRPSGMRTASGEYRRPIGAELRLINYVRGRMQQQQITI